MHCQKYKLLQQIILNDYNLQSNIIKEEIPTQKEYTTKMLKAQKITK